MKKTSFKGRIFIGFLFIFITLLITTLYAIWQLRDISHKTDLVYKYPYKVSNAVRDIQTDVYKSFLLVHDLEAADTKTKIDSLINEIMAREAKTNENIKIVKEHYLGKKSDVDSAVSSIYTWRKIGRAHV